MSELLPISVSFDETRPPCGWVELGDYAQTLIEDMFLNGGNYVLSPELLVTKQKQDGQPLEVELKGFGLVPAERAVDHGQQRDTMCLNNKGQCPICLVKPLTYKRDSHHYCTRCSRAFDLTTGVWASNSAWVKPWTMQGSAAIVAARNSGNHNHAFVESKDNDSYVCRCGLSVTTTAYLAEHSAA